MTSYECHDVWNHRQFNCLGSLWLKLWNLIPADLAFIWKKLTLFTRHIYFVYQIFVPVGVPCINKDEKKTTTRPTLERRDTLGHLRPISPNMINRYRLTTSPTNQRPANFWKKFKTLKKNPQKWCNLRLNWYGKSISIVQRVGNNRRTVKTSAPPHISDQSGTENACKTLLRLLIVMTWVLVCNNMYRYERHFGSFSAIQQF